MLVTRTQRAGDDDRVPGLRRHAQLQRARVRDHELRRADNIDVAGYPTTAACPAFSYTPVRTATVAQRLLQS